MARPEPHIRIDLSARLTLGFVFGIAGLTVELVGGFVGLPVSGALVATFGSIIVATFGVGLITGPSQVEEDEDDR